MLATLVVKGLGKGKQPRPDLVIHDLTQDDKETMFPLAPSKKKECQSRWRYVKEEEWVARQTVKDQFREVAAAMTHLGPHSAQCAIPYPRLQMNLTAM